MFRGKLLAIALILAILPSVAACISLSKATPQVTLGSGVTVLQLSAGELPEYVQVKIREAGSNSNVEIGQMQVYKFTIAPGGYTGWRQYGGPQIIVVASGTLTYYQPDSASCTMNNYPPHGVIFDPGSTPYDARNEGTTTVVSYVAHLRSLEGTSPIDVPALVDFCNWHGPARTRHFPS